MRQATGESEHMFRVAVLAFTLLLAAGPIFPILCGPSCDGINVEDISKQVCRQAVEHAVGTADACADGVTAVPAIVREDAQRTLNLTGARDGALMSQCHFQPDRHIAAFCAHGLTDRSAAVAPHSLALRI